MGNSSLEGTTSNASATSHRTWRCGTTRRGETSRARRWRKKRIRPRYGAPGGCPLAHSPTRSHRRSMISIAVLLSLAWMRPLILRVVLVETPLPGAARPAGLGEGAWARHGTAVLSEMRPDIETRVWISAAPCRMPGQNAGRGWRPSGGGEAGRTRMISCQLTPNVVKYE